jgi:TPP-dependent pyruvate/acetoin dehydrogenase alpha subunit
MSKVMISQKLLYEMIKIRKVEERIAKLYHDQEMRCPVHLSIGQEPLAVAICSELMNTDLVFSGHRAHAHYLAKGGSLKKMLAEIYGKSTGCCQGRGGSMHLSDLDAGFVASTPIVGSTIPIAVGAALSIKQKNTNNIVVVFFGDGAMETGVAYESINFAAVNSLPIIFVCENNLYSVYSPLSVRQPKNREIVDLAKAHGITAFSLDGNNIDQIITKTKSIRYGILNKNMAPAFLEIKTYRWLEHCGPNYDNDIGYRSEDEFLLEKNKDILDILIYQNSSYVSEIMIKIEKEIDEAFLFAQNS